jgi:hypothetical protein
MMLDNYAEGIERAPRMIAATWRAYIEGGTTARVFVLICVGLFGAILVGMVSVAVVAVGIAGKLIRGQPDAADARVPRQPGATLSPWARRTAGAFVLAFGGITVMLFSSLLVFALALVGDHLHRKGDFSGAGAQVVWPAGR